MDENMHIAMDTAANLAAIRETNLHSYNCNASKRNNSNILTVTRQDATFTAIIFRWRHSKFPASLKLRPYGAIQICLLLLLLLLLCITQYEQ